MKKRVGTGLEADQHENSLSENDDEDYDNRVRPRRAWSPVSIGFIFAGLSLLSMTANAENAAEDKEGGGPSATDAAAADEVHRFKLEYNPFTVLTFCCIALSLVLASSSGIGGGGILVPIYILMLGAPGKVAIPLSNITILGGGIGNNIFNLSKRHPLKDRPMIDYDTVMML